ncbi:trypsin [Enterobacter roggenkampii]|uniref:S1 family peptidase n=1 Tax=Enterobacter roggenkampii TaxID=1812935 RepID=UPI00077BBE42|nr:serine protease [Enterobacter roggenkampii]PJD13982.1 trypsin [Enterobacter roggenkampii]PJD18264.1 trypsin [Enterobacter roggenkampii]PJD20322.1 trypsin [Enterobacter roggenkampii]
MSISEDIHKSTVRIECDVKGGGTSVGTGFWFCFIDKNDKDRFFPLLITNKHVIQNASQIRLRINVSHKTDANIKFYDLIIPQGESAFIMHPDKDVDICVLPVGSQLSEMERHELVAQIFFFNDQNMRGGNYITPVEDIYMTGYPNGLWDSVNNRPVTRKGITASSPLEDWKGKQEFLIDIACFGGSSGSPVYIMNQGSYAIEGGIATGGRFIFLGLLYAGPVLDVSGRFEVIEVPTAATTVVRSTVTMNLGLVIKAEKINDFKKIFGI